MQMPETADKQKCILRRTAVSMALILVTLGSVMMIAWLIHNAWAEAVVPGFYYMKFNTTLLFIISGAGLLAILRKAKPLILTAGVVIVLSAGLTLLEYITDINPGLDEFLQKDIYFIGGPYAGRMAPNSALAFFCTGVAIILMAENGIKHTLRVPVMELLGFLVFALGAEGIFGHIQIIVQAYSWGGYTRMAPQTAAGFVALGTGLTAAAWYQHTVSIARVPLWIPGLLCLTTLFFDMSTSRDIAGGIVYLPLVFCSLWFNRANTVFVFAAIATIMTVIAFFAKIPGHLELWQVVVNRMLTLTALWFMATIIYLRQKTDQALRQSEDKIHSLVLQDIAQRKKAENTLRENQERYQALVESSAQVVWSWQQGAIDKMSQISSWWENTTGQPADNIATFGWLEMVHPEDRERMRATWVDALAQCKGFETQYRLRTRSGRYIYIELRSVALTNADGSLREFVGTLNDITERKHAEEKTALLAAIITNSDDAIISKTLQGIITSWNAGAQKLFGYSPDEACGKHIGLIIPKERLGEEKLIVERLHNGKGFEHFETERLHKNGKPIAVSLTVSPILDASGKTIGASKILRDITSQKTSESALLHYMAALERSNKELDDFAYIASHDLKEPLRGLFNNARFLEKDYADKLDAEGISRIRRLGYLSQRMEQLVNDLLYFSRLGRQEMAIQPTNLGAVIHDIESMMEMTLKENNAAICMPQNLPEIICDRPRVTEVFRNLISNAVKYNDKENKVIEIGLLNEMRIKKNIKKNVFYVRDNGIGIEKEFHEEIFRIFKRLNEEDDDKKGTGVGLTFVRKIIDRHGGSIWLESEPGQGTTFYFTIAQGEKHAAA